MVSARSPRHGHHCPQLSSKGSREVTNGVICSTLKLSGERKAIGDDNMKTQLHISTALALSWFVVGGCYFGKIDVLPEKYNEPDTASVLGCNDGDPLVQAEVTFLQTANNGCIYGLEFQENDVGTSYFLTGIAPTEVSVPANAEMGYVVDNTVDCVEPQDYVDLLGGQDAASLWLVDYDVPAQCNTNCAQSGTTNQAFVSSLVTFCDVNEDHPANSTSGGDTGDTGPSGPPAPTEGEYEHTRSTGYFSGKYSYRILERSSGHVCMLLTWKPTGLSERMSGLVLAEETDLPGSKKKYEYVAGSYINSLPGAEFTVEEDGANRKISGTAGTSALDTRFSTSGTHTFTPVSGGGSLASKDAAFFHELCTRMFDDL